MSGQHFQQTMHRLGKVVNPALIVVSRKGKMLFSLSPFVQKNLISRDGLGRPVPRQPALSPHS